MPKEKLVIRDPAFRIKDKELEKRLNEKSAEHLAQAEKKENERFEKQGLIDMLFSGAQKISCALSRKNKNLSK